MTDYIDREAALHEVCRECNAPDPSEKEVCPYRFTGCREYAALVVVPAADVRPVVRGKWIRRFYYREATKSYDCEMLVCNECRSEWSYDAETGSSDFNFCPSCGADMKPAE